MDEPIFYTHAIRSVSPDKPPKELYDYLEFALVNDNKEEFLRLINEPDFFGYGVDRLLGFDCPKIATAIINGEATCINDDDDDDLLLFKGGWTPMHLACFGPSPRLIQDLIDRDVPVDVPCDYAPLHFERVTPLDLALEFIDTGYKYGYRTIDRPWTPNCSIFELLHYVCNWQRSRLEVIRLLVKKTKNKDLVRRAFFEYAVEGKFIKLTALFLAVPELFLPPSLESHGVIDQLYHHLESLPNKNDIQDGILLLLDVFYLVGHKLVAYIRVYESKDWLRAIYYGEIKIGFFLGEVVRKLERKKPGSSSLDGYLLRFFMPVSQLDYPRRLYYMKQTATCGMFLWNLFEREDTIDINYVNRMISRLVPHEEDVLKKAINNKLSVMLTIRTVFKDMRKQFRSRKRRIELMRVDPFCTKVANANVFRVMVRKSLAMNPT